jgi:hypothetical protein
LIYVRLDRHFVILAVAPDKKKFQRAVLDARSRLAGRG